MASLDGDTLPPTLRYAPFIQDKRYSITPTAAGAVFQEAAAGIIHGDGILEWTMELLCFEELCLMYDLYQRQGPLDFVGQYGEEYVVEFVNMRVSAQGGGNYSINGTFIIRCVTRDICTSGYY